MKGFKKVMTILAIIVAYSLFATGCSGYMDNAGNRARGELRLTDKGENEYNEIIENKFISTQTEPKSTFSMDCNTAAYSLLRRSINDGRQIDKNQIRVEEMVNYFNYDYPLPTGNEPLSVNGYISDCPWNSDSKLLTVGLRAKDVELSAMRNNLVFLLDISGSMDSLDKIGLMQSAFSILAENLNDDDIVSIVTYAGGDAVILEGAWGSDRKRIQNKIEDLTAGGSTAGSKGILTAYELAEKYFISGGNNRVILATDGDFNVGISSQTKLEELISEKRATGVYLSVLGFGYGNLKDNKMETLANNGNGNYAYIDSIFEARKVLVEEIGGTLVTVAKDAKAQVEFNPSKISSYRLLGYENKLLTEQDWENSEKDAGEIGAGHSVTAVYEIVLCDTQKASTMANNLLSISVRYKTVDDNEQKELNRFISGDDITITPSDDIRFISAVVEAALILRNSEYKKDASLDSVIERLEGISSINADPYKTEFLSLMKKLKQRKNY